ncbi:UDP-N-acetylmuramyl pentapeptide phosphotransferase [Natronospora cellulosivora (SeqCode)]
MYKKILKKYGLIKENYQNKEIAVVGGLIISLFAFIFWWLFSQYLRYEFSLDHQIFYMFTLIAALGFLDDIAGSKEKQGFKGHFQSFLEGNITTGFLKASISLITVFLVFYSYQLNSIFELFINIGIILLMTNFLNLLDLRPARAIKFFFLISLLVLLFMPITSLYFLPIYLVIIIYLPLELKNKLMLGDMGANFLGAVLGFSIVLFENIALKFFILLILVILTLISEKLSISKLISSNTVLNYIDQIGRMNKE